MILEFKDLDDLAETLWGLITSAVFSMLEPDSLRSERRQRISHATWLAMPEDARDAAREIALEIAKIFEVKQ